jgi:hypothetical protein
MKTISGLSNSYKVLLGKLFGTWYTWVMQPRLPYPYPTAIKYHSALCEIVGIYLLYKCEVAKLGSIAGNFLSGKSGAGEGERAREKER